MTGTPTSKPKHQETTNHQQEAKEPMAVKKSETTASLHRHVSDDEAKRILIYVKRCCDMLRLSHYDIELGHKPCVEDANASITVCKGRYIATVYVAEAWEDMSEILKRRTLLHEALHITHAEVVHCLETMIGDNTAVSQDIWSAVRDIHDENLERMVDRMTRTFDTLDLLPAWPTARDISKYNHEDHQR